jgi:hypothetical protein
VIGSEETGKLFDGEAGLPDDAAKRAGGQITAVHSDDDAGPRLRWMSQHVVTAFDHGAAP